MTADINERAPAEGGAIRLIAKNADDARDGL